MLQEATSLSDGGGRALLYVPFEEDCGFLAYLVGPSGTLSGLKRVSFPGGSGVALDRGEAHVEGASSLSFGHATFYGGNYLLTEVFRVGFHSPMIAHRSIFMLTAVGGTHLDQSLLRNQAERRIYPFRSRMAKVEL
jgi:hypothetical protein